MIKKTENKSVLFKQPIIIVGAPRSGTSLIYSILREQPGCVSLAKESGIIWNRYCHPSLSNWYASCCPTNYFTPETRADIHKQFASFAFSSALWSKLNRVDLLNYHDNRLFAATIRRAYSWLALTRRKLPEKKLAGKLIEKSVGTIFCLDFVNYVFPDALFIRVFRDGRTNIRSMIDAWRDENRFFTFLLPDPLEIKEYRHNYWNFALPPNWQDCAGKTLTETVARQWMAMQLAIDEGLEQPYNDGRVLNIKLEELTHNPEQSLKDVSAFTGLNWNNNLATKANNLPIVNPTPDRPNINNQHNTDNHRIREITPLIEGILSEQGYRI